ncbi:hypothetical protein H1R20_g16420, partial [Candolleomyces eurysporus]
MAQIAASHAEDLRKMTESKLGTLSLVLQHVYSNRGDASLSDYTRNVTDFQEVLEYAKDMPLNTPILFPQRLNATTQAPKVAKYHWTTDYESSILYNPPTAKDDLGSLSYVSDDAMDVAPPQTPPYKSMLPTHTEADLRRGDLVPGPPSPWEPMSELDAAAVLQLTIKDSKDRGEGPSAPPLPPAPASASQAAPPPALASTVESFIPPYLDLRLYQSIFAEEYQQTSVAMKSAIGVTHPALDLFYQMNCLKSNIARIDGEIEALSFLRCASVMQLASLHNRYESDSHLPDPPPLLPTVPTPTPSPTKKVPKEIKETKETPKEPKEKKPKLAKTKAPSSKVIAEGSSKAKAKETVPKTRAKATREASETKTRAKTQAAPATETTKGKGKQRATTKPKEVVEKKEIVEEPVKEPEVEKKKEVAEELAKEEGEALSWGDEDIEMEETGAAGEDKLVEEEEYIAEEEEETN